MVNNFQYFGRNEKSKNISCTSELHKTLAKQLNVLVTSKHLIDKIYGHYNLLFLLTYVFPFAINLFYSSSFVISYEKMNSVISLHYTKARLLIATKLQSRIETSEFTKLFAGLNTLDSTMVTTFFCKSKSFKKLYATSHFRRPFE